MESDLSKIVCSKKFKYGKNYVNWWWNFSISQKKNLKKIFFFCLKCPETQSKIKKLKEFNIFTSRAVAESNRGVAWCCSSSEDHRLQNYVILVFLIAYTNIFLKKNVWNNYQKKFQKVSKELKKAQNNFLQIFILFWFF